MEDDGTTRPRDNDWHHAAARGERATRFMRPEARATGWSSLSHRLMKPDFLEAGEIRNRKAETGERRQHEKLIAEPK